MTPVPLHLQQPPSIQFAMAMSSSSFKKTLLVEALMVTLSLAMLTTAASQPSPGTSTSTPTNLTLHNLCPYPVWPLVTANAGIPSIPTDADGEPAGRLDGHGEGLVTLAFPPGAWSGRVVARTGCSTEEDGDGDEAVVGRCATGDAPPVTVAQVSVGGPGGHAAYSVSLVDGFNVPVVVTPHGFPEGRRRCPTLGCAVDLAAECPVGARAPGGGCGAGASEAAWFKARCPDTRTNATDVEVTPQDCVAPGEIKVVFCPAHL